MKQQLFESRHDELWRALESYIENPDEPVADLPSRYRQVCHHFALARHRNYSPYLVTRLNRLVMALHHRIYQGNIRYRYQWLRFLVFDFPYTLRVNATFVWVATALFLVPFVVMWLGCFLNEDLVYSFMPPYEVSEFEHMYDPEAEVVGRERTSATDLQMFGFYIKNNIGIAFRMFAAGILFGVGTIFFLVYNGIFLGGLSGYIAKVGYASTFYPFVIGHGAFELTAIVLSGAAGLKLGFALVSPGCYSRTVALKRAGKEAIKIMYGAFAMLVIAAFLEAFWSSKASIPAEVKYAVGACLWAAVFVYFFWSGRGYSDAN